MNEYRHFTHFIDIGPEFRCALSHGTKKIDPDRLPVGADQVEHKCSAIGVAGLSEAIKLVLGHSISDPDVFSVKVSSAYRLWTALQRSPTSLKWASGWFS